MSGTNKVVAFIGSYAESSEPGLYACSFDTATGHLEVLDQMNGWSNPTFLDVDEERKMIYPLANGVNADEQMYGAVAAIHFDPASGKLSLLNQAATVPASICHITLDRSKRFLIVSSYHGGMVGLSPVLADGSVGPMSDSHRHPQGSGVLPAQTQARVHSAFMDPANRFAVISDLGADQVVVYRLDAAVGKLIPHSTAQVAPGAGPRHFAFHPTLPYGYVINELNATITVFAYDGENGTLTEVQTVSTLPSSWQGVKSCADIHISPDGRFLYGSNRGHDSIAVFAIEGADGHLEMVEVVSTLGGHPRNFALSPDGKFLLAANRDGDNIVTFSRDETSGKLRPTGDELKLSKPVCVKITRSPMAQG